MQQRILGKTGRSLSIVGFGGIAVMNETPENAGRLVAEAIERGVNYFDVAPSYGNAEERLGPALAPYRGDVFLACKTGCRDREGAWEELHASLRTLQTDHFDLYQFHGITRMEEVEQILAPGGAMEAFLAAREAGLIRHIGFSAHSEEAAITLLERFPFDTILFPLNWVCWHQGRFGQRVVEKAQALGAGILALKTLAKGPWREGEERRWPKCWYHPIEDTEEALPAARFTFSLPVTAAPSPGHAELFRLFCNVSERFSALSEEEAEIVARRTEGMVPIFQNEAEI